MFLSPSSGRSHLDKTIDREEFPALGAFLDTKSDD